MILGFTRLNTMASKTFTVYPYIIIIPKQTFTNFRRFCLFSVSVTCHLLCLCKPTPQIAPNRAIKISRKYMCSSFHSHFSVFYKVLEGKSIQFLLKNVFVEIIKIKH